MLRVLLITLIAMIPASKLAADDDSQPGQAGYDAELAASDPAIEAGRLMAEYHPWYASAALMQLGKVHERIARESP